MILKSHEISKINLKKNNLVLFYGKNEGLKIEEISKIISTNLDKDILNYEEKEILENQNNFIENILSKSLFEKEKIIIIKRATDKILKIIDDIITKNLEDLTIIINADILEKKSKLRSFFEKDKKLICVPFYPDNEQTLSKLAYNFLRDKKISISSSNINLIVNKCSGDRETLINELQKTLASKHGVPVESIVITGGSNEALRVTGLAISSQGGNIVAGKPTYLALMSYAEGWGSKIKWVPVDSEKGYDLNKIKSSVDGETKMIFIANPNNPTGTLLNKQSLKDFCEEMSQKTILFCDEAYYDYINEDHYPSMDYLIRKGENVIISRTFSKVYGLAGLRIGYLVLKPELADQLFGDYSVYRRPNIMAQTNVLAVSAASEALKDEDFYKFSLDKANAEKDKIYKLLDYLNLKYIKSSTNFVFFESKKHINELSEQMLEKGVMVGRPFPPFYDWCRISTGTSEEVDVFMQAMLEVYG